MTADLPSGHDSTAPAADRIKKCASCVPLSSKRELRVHDTCRNTCVDRSEIGGEGGILEALFRLLDS